MKKAIILSLLSSFTFGMYASEGFVEITKNGPYGNLNYALENLLQKINYGIENPAAGKEALSDLFKQKQEIQTEIIQIPTSMTKQQWVEFGNFFTDTVKKIDPVIKKIYGWLNSFFIYKETENLYRQFLSILETLKLELKKKSKTITVQDIGETETLTPEELIQKAREYIKAKKNS